MKKRGGLRYTIDFKNEGKICTLSAISNEITSFRLVTASHVRLFQYIKKKEVKFEFLTKIGVSFFFFRV